MSSFGFDAPEDVTDTTHADVDSLPVPPEDPAEVDDAEAPGEATGETLDEGADARLAEDARLDDDQDPPEHPFVPSPS